MNHTRRLVQLWTKCVFYMLISDLRFTKYLRQNVVKATK